MRYKERKWSYCQERKMCKMSVTNKNKKRCKLRDTEGVITT